MISRRTKIQLTIFALITAIGCAFVGARYARLTQLVVPDSYIVTAHFPDSGGIFTGSEVSYRGVLVGQVSDMVLTAQGVDLKLKIKNQWNKIPSNTLAIVANKSAVGEQYVELEPQTDAGPYLKGDSQIAETNARLPIATQTLLTDLSNTVESVNTKDLQSVVTEFGTAFAGTGPALGQIIDTTNAFIQDANANFDVTTNLIKDANVVLRGQIASTSAIKNWARSLSLFSTTLAGADPDLRKVIDSGSATANQLRTFLQQNQVDLSELINELVTTGQIVVKHLDGIRQMLVIYPYVVEGGFTVVAKDPTTGMYDAHFGMVTTNNPPVCHAGYQGTRHRPPQNGANWPMNVNARCTEGGTSFRGAQHAPANRPATGYGSSPVVASYDPTTGKIQWGVDLSATEGSASVAVPQTFGEDSWKWLYLQPLTGRSTPLEANQGR